MKTSIAILTAVLLTCLLSPPVALSAELDDFNAPLSSRTTVVFWTNESSQGPIRVYVNKCYAGTITTRYSSAPRCGAPGCVTVVLSGRNNTWYGVASDGTRWFGGNSKLRPGCNSIRLHHAGVSDGDLPIPPPHHRHPSRRGPGFPPASEPIEDLGYGWENMMASSHRSHNWGVPYFGVELGASVFYGEFARALFATGKNSGLYLYGGVGKDLLFDWKNSDKLLWHGGIGMRYSFDSDHYSVGLVYGENPQCFNRAVLIEFVWRHYFGDSQIVGVFAGAGAGLGDFKAKEPAFVWDVQAGISIKLWQH